MLVIIRGKAGFEYTRKLEQGGIWCNWGYDTFKAGHIYPILLVLLKKQCWKAFIHDVIIR